MLCRDSATFDKSSVAEGGASLQVWIIKSILSVVTVGTEGMLCPDEQSETGARVFAVMAGVVWAIRVSWYKWLSGCGVVMVF
jgi:hypothetical protein